MEALKGFGIADTPVVIRDLARGTPYNRRFLCRLLKTPPPGEGAGKILN